MNQEGEFEGYRVEEVLSRSSSTTVYRAFQLSLQRLVLIKELRPELIRDKAVMERFEREAQVCAHIKHENIVHIYDRSVQAERVFLVMEYVQGCSLEVVIAGYTLVPVDLALAVMLQTLRGLAFAHSQSVIHRDIKPGNILISRDGMVKITDFGLAMLEGSPVITQPGAVVGTPAYLAPEAISGGTVSSASDIFSLGVTFYELLTGQKVFHAEHFSDSLKKVLSFHPPPLAHWRDDLPADLDRIILRMLEKQPAKRWSNAGDILNAFGQQGLLANIGDAKQAIHRYWEEPPTPSASALQVTPSTRYIKAKRRVYLFRIAGILMALVLLIGYLITSRKSEVILGSSSDSLTNNQPSADSLTPQVSQITKDTSTVKPDLTSVQKQVTPDKKEQQAESIPPPVPLVTKPDTGKPHPGDKTPSSDLIADARPSQLAVHCDPWADVYLDDVLIDKTPFESIEIKPGPHRLAFRHPAFPPIFRDIEAKPGQAIDLNVNFWGTVGRIYVLVDTWAEVYVDGIKKGVTPLQEPIVVSLGTHKIALINPSFPPWEKDVIFQRDDPPCTLKVQLKAPHGLLPTQKPTQTPDDSLRLGNNFHSSTGDSLQP